MNNSTLIPNNATNNSSGYYCKYDEPDTQLEFNAKRIVVILLMTLGLAGNIFVIVLAMKYTVRKNLHHLIINMAVSDSLFILMILTGFKDWLAIRLQIGFKVSWWYPWWYSLQDSNISYPCLIYSFLSYSFDNQHRTIQSNEKNTAKITCLHIKTTRCSNRYQLVDSNDNTVLHFALHFCDSKMGVMRY